jgi:integrase
MKVQVRGVFVTNTQVNGGPRQLYSQFVVRANHLDELVVLGTLTAPAASFLAAGESVVAVAERLGHENGTLVLKTYGHLMPIRRTERAGRLTPRGPLTA